MDFLPAAFSAMASYTQFIVYKLIPSVGRPGKFDKIPVSPEGNYINLMDPKNWLSAQDALMRSQMLGGNYGIGFVFTEKDPFFFIDIDDCLLPCGTAWSPLANTLLLQFQGAAVEVSASGKGLHIFAKGAAPEHACKNTDLKLELYTRNRFVALTGTHASGDSGMDFTIQLYDLVANYFKNSTPAESLVPVSIWTTEPVAAWRGPTSDTDLINRALRSTSAQSVFGGKASFKDLWDANEIALGKSYPDSNRAYDASSADRALAQHLAFWTGNDCDRIQRIMQQSSLVREKWNRDDYLYRTITSATSVQKDFLQDKELNVSQPVEPGIVGEPALNTNATMLSADNQLILFKGCTIVVNESRILMPGGDMRDKTQFNLKYSRRSFPIDAANAKVTKDAWEACTQSQLITVPIADRTVFRPKDDFGLTYNEGGQILVNKYWPIYTPRVVGDPSPLVDHAKRVLPDGDDHLILLYYMAAILQYYGVKFNWAILLQGVQGNGKTFFTRVMTECVGLRYCHFPKAQELGSKFNDWLPNKIFIGVEDINVGNSIMQNETYESMKVLTTREIQEIEPKGGAKYNAEICANFIFNTNAKDGIRKTDDDRRYASLHCAQQEKSDLARDGLTGEYFDGLYNWGNKRQGWAICNEYLRTLKIPDEFNPATKCNRPPHTTTTDSAIAYSRSDVEVQTIEAIESGEAGFRGGYISSFQLDRFLKNNKLDRNLGSHKQRPELLKKLGYIRHPSLTDGRVTAIIPNETKCRIYIKQNHPDINLKTSAEIAKAYQEAQKQ
jgi:primase-polymerase (primpol)-like protein